MSLPTALTFIVIAVGLALRQLLYFAEMATSAGVAPADLGPLFMLELVRIVALALPFALMSGVLLGVGRLVADRAVLAMSAAGIAPIELLRPILLVAGVVAGLTLLLTGWVVPRASTMADQQLADLAARRPLVAVQPGVPFQLGDWRLDALSVGRGGTVARGAVLISGQRGLTLSAGSARFVRVDPSTVELRLTDVVTLLDARDGPRSARLESLNLPIALAELASSRSVEERLEGRATLALWSRVSSGVAEVSESLELQGRFALPASAFVLALAGCALALGLPQKRSVQLAAALGVYASAYGVMLLADDLARSGRIEPWLGAWLPNSVLGLATLAGAGWLLPRSLRSAPSRRAGRRFRISTWVPGSPRSAARSWVFGRYLTRQVLVVGLGCLAVAITMALVAQILQDRSWTTAVSVPASLVAHYHAMTLPSVVSGLIPFTLMTAVALTLGVMARDGELVGLMASGISGVAIVAPILWVALAAAVGHLVLVGLVVPVATESAALDRYAIVSGRGPGARQSYGAIIRHGGLLAHFERVDTVRGVATGVTVHRLDGKGLVIDRIDAPSAVRSLEGTWRLLDARTVHLDGGGVAVRRSPGGAVRLPDHALRQSNSQQFSILDIGEEIRATEVAGFDARRLRLQRAGMWTGPAATLLLPLFVALLASTGPPFPRLSVVLISAVVAAAGYALLTGIARALGRGGLIGETASGFGPAVLLVVVVALTAAAGPLIRHGRAVSRRRAVTSRRASPADSSRES